MIRLALISLCALPASASPLEREAGWPHVYMPETPAEAAMMLGDLYGIHVEPIIEEPGVCPQAWHWLADWHARDCPGTMDVYQPKLPTESVYVVEAPEAEGYPAILLAPGGIAGGATSWPAPLATGWLVAGSSGGDYRGGDSGSVYRVDLVESHFRVTHHHYSGCPCGCCELPEEPAPVPLPASFLLFAGALASLFATGLTRPIKESVGTTRPLPPAGRRAPHDRPASR